MKLAKFIGMSAGAGIIVGYIWSMSDRNLAAVLAVAVILAGLVLLAKAGK